MPIPKPTNDENRDSFLSRCMSDDKMLEEFPKPTQRMAVCIQSWNDKIKF